MNLDPKVREKLLRESRNPFLGFRRTVWGLLFGSAAVGLFIMIFRAIAKQNVLIGDFGIQLAAFFLFGGLIFFDRQKND